MFRLFMLLLLLGGLIALLVVGAQAYATWRIRSVLLEVGVADRVATCVAERMVERLSLVQLAKLRALENDEPSLDGWLSSARQVGDREIILVAISSAGLCQAGFGR
jgi:hypothetical protein